MKSLIATYKSSQTLSENKGKENIEENQPLALPRTETLNDYNFSKWGSEPKIGNRKSTLLYRLI
jgi:hypothetical protein